MNTVGLYVHIPFCLKKCSYCDFASYSAEEELFEKYANALIKEVRAAASYLKDKEVDTVYFGGGTPSLLPVKTIERIIDSIREAFNISKDGELTIECNPKTLDFEKAVFFKSFFNRISLGVQSLQDTSLEIIGRSHKVLDFFESYAMIRLAGFENISYDLMFGLPEQTVDMAKYDVEKILSFNPKHLSIYSLSLEEGTPLYENRKRYSFMSDEENRGFYAYIKDYLQKNEFYRYEISNYSKKGYESRHNTKYWELKEYLGIGLSAASFTGNRRFSNPKGFKEYFEYVEQGPSFLRGEEMSKRELMGDFMFLGLRKTKGVVNADFKRLFNESFYDVYENEIEKHLKNKLISTEGERIFLTEKGLDLANEVMCDFV